MVWLRHLPLQQGNRVPEIAQSRELFGRSTWLPLERAGVDLAHLRHRQGRTTARLVIACSTMKSASSLAPRLCSEPARLTNVVLPCAPIAPIAIGGSAMGVTGPAQGGPLPPCAILCNRIYTFTCICQGSREAERATPVRARSADPMNLIWVIPAKGAAARSSSRQAATPAIPLGSGLRPFCVLCAGSEGGLWVLISCCLRA
jgi:hypothetical protein